MLRLAQIELLGFKSFPHKTVVDLDPSVTCVVGPNGSGKSNLADAINFAFGSQSGRELRAHKLSGLIFAGTDQLRPLNMCSVTLHFERTAAEMVAPEDSLAGLAALASDELDLPEIASASRPIGSQLDEQEGFAGTQLTRHIAGPVEEYDRTPQVIKELAELQPGQRISLTRRVFRDGTGGYFINDQPVRLKDIDALFNRFNLGRSAVFSISQGEVEKKILETPQELRSWLAEATGVALLLQQKQRAQNKLKRTRQNLERLEDIRSNTRELVEDLAGQRKLAEEHITFRDQLRAVELNEIRREIEFSQKQQDGTAKSLEEIKEQLANVHRELEERRREYSRVQAARQQVDHELAMGEDVLAQKRERLAQLRQEAAVARRAAESARQALTQDRQDRETLLAEVNKSETELEQNEEQAKAHQAELDKLRASGTELRAKLEEAQRNEQDVAARQSELANRGFELAQQEARLANHIESLSQNDRQLAAQIAERSERLEVSTNRLVEGEQELATHQQQAEQLALSVGEQRDELEAQQQALAKLAEDISSADAECGQRRDRLAQLNSRRRTIAELAEEAEDPESGPARLLADDALASRLKRVTEITFPDELRPAFTRLLAHLGDAVIGRPDACPAALSVLAGSGGDALMLTGADTPVLHPESLWRSLSAPPEVLAALFALLGDVLPVSSLDEARTLLAREPQAAAAVLADGSALVGRGFAYLGAPAPERALKVARVSDLSHLDTQIASAQAELGEAEDRLADLRASQAQGQWNRDELSSKLAAAEERLRQALSLSDRLHQAIEERRAEHQLLEHQSRQLQTDHAKLQEELPRLATELAEIKLRRAEASAASAELDAQRAAATQALEAARQAHAQAVTRSELAEQRGLHLKQAGLDLAERLNNLRNRLARSDERLADHENEIKQNEDTAARADLAAQDLSGTLANAGDNLDGLRTRRAELEAAAEGGQEQLVRLSAEVSRLEQDEVSQAALRDRALERIEEWLTTLRERYSLSLSQLLADPAITAPPPGATLDASEAGRGKLREEKARLSQRLEEIGPVNLLAIEQHQQHSQRLAFLDGQAAELTRALTDLEQIVGDLDATTEKSYRSSLRQIEGRFNEAYLKLFGSGWARLRFEDPEAIIDSGVEVEVQLPGGRRHSLRSLSGGQRSLIFLALFFAVHSVRSPGFCILDEADAALDDANVERFVKLIRNVSQGEQFIVITHNKVTMETADKLVGVVGRPKGVSNLLSVDLREARKLVDKTVA